MTRQKHGHPHDGQDDGSDPWARQHAEKGERREAGLAPVVQALLRDAVVKPGQHVLDVACGAGDTTAAATALGAKATGIDTSRAMIQIAQERFPQTHFEEGNMLNPPRGPWHAVLCRLGAHHADPAWLSSTAAVLRPGGRLAIAERDAVDRESRAKGMKSLGEWMTLLEQAGFTHVTARPSGGTLDGPIYVVSGRTRDPDNE